MLVRSLARFAVCLALTATPSLVLAQAASPAAGGAQALATPTKAAASGVKHYDPDEVVCHYMAVTGTRFPKRACMRRAEWDQMTQDSKDDLNHATSVTNRPGA